MSVQEGLELEDVMRVAGVSSGDEAPSANELRDEAFPEGETPPEESARLKRLKAGECDRVVEEARIRPAERAVIR